MHLRHRIKCLYISHHFLIETSNSQRMRNYASLQIRHLSVNVYHRYMSTISTTKINLEQRQNDDNVKRRQRRHLPVLHASWFHTNVVSRRLGKYLILFMMHWLLMRMNSTYETAVYCVRNGPKYNDIFYWISSKSNKMSVKNAWKPVAFLDRNQ